jgi:hypothetical protein
MTDGTTSADEGPARGWRVVDASGRPIGTVDAVFADYLLVRTPGLLPVDLYIPRTAIGQATGESVQVTAADADAAYRSWHRPLKAAPHD